MLEPVVTGGQNNQDLLEMMVTDNAFVVCMNQTNLELGASAVRKHEIVKRNSKHFELVVHVMSLYLLTNNVYQPHNLPKTYFSPPNSKL